MSPNLKRFYKLGLLYARVLAYSKAEFGDIFKGRQGMRWRHK